ncbi:MAG: hypothetical protein RR330_07010 [Alistipes sp.]
MRKLFLLAAILSVAFLSGCNDSNSTFHDPYDGVGAGITIYNAAYGQNDIALDPTAVAIRLEMLLAEAEKQQVDFSTVKVTYGKALVNAKDLFFGTQTTIVKTTEGVYTITYNGSTPGRLDYYYRRGAYVVNTFNHRLSADGQPWTVTLGQAGMVCWSVGPFGDKIEMQIQEMGATTITRQETRYSISFLNFKAYLANSRKYTSDWSGDFYFTTSVNADDLSYSAQQEAVFTLLGGARGASLYTLNNTTPLHLSYAISAANPLKWDPSKSSSFRLIVGGEETATLTSTADYNVADYPASSVTVTRTLNDKVVSIKVSYNGITIIL